MFAENPMSTDQEIINFLFRHLGSIFENDIATYHQTTSEELTLYEWFVTPHRLEGLGFHDFMMKESIRSGTVFGVENVDKTGEPVTTRFDLSNLSIQQYGDTAIACYTLLISSSSKNGVSVKSHNESRVMVKLEKNWKVVHVHKSPTWSAPHIMP